MERYFDTALNNKGEPAVGLTVTVTDSNGNMATLYSDNGVKQMSNPFYTDRNGALSFYAANGRYNVALTADGVAPQSIKDIVLLDPVDKYNGDSLLAGQVSADLTGYKSDVANTANGKGADLVANAAKKVASVAALRGLRVPAGSDAQTVIVDGYHQPIVWNATSTATDDGGTIFKPNSLTSAQAGRWLLVNPGPVDIRLFGASPTATNAANFSTLNSAIAAIDAAGGGVIVIPHVINYGYKRTDKTTWPYALSALAAPVHDITIIDFSPGNTYTSGSDGAQERIWLKTNSSNGGEAAGDHDGNTRWHRAKYHPVYALSNDAQLAPANDPSRTSNDNRQAHVMLCNDGVTTWLIGQGGNSGAGLSDDQLSGFNITANNFAGGTGLTNVFGIDKTNGNAWFNANFGDAYGFYMLPGSNNTMRVRAASGNPAILLQNDNASGNKYTRMTQQTAGGVQIDLSGTNCGSINADGSWSFGSGPTGSEGTVNALSNIAGTQALTLQNKGTAGTNYLAYFMGESAAVGSITHNGTSTTYGTTSDYRLKDVIGPASAVASLARVRRMAAIAKDHTFKADPEKKVVTGWLAHELAEIFPAAVVGEKDGTEEVTVYEEVTTSKEVDVYDQVDVPQEIPVYETVEATLPDGTATHVLVEKGTQTVNVKQSVVVGKETVTETQRVPVGKKTEIVPQHVDLSKLVPDLVLAIEALTARNEQLEARLKAAGL